LLVFIILLIQPAFLSAILVYLNRVWANFLSLVFVSQPLSHFKKVAKFHVKHFKLLVCKTKRFPVGKTFKSSHLVEKNQVVILKIEVDGVQVLLEEFGVHHIDASLF